MQFALLTSALFLNKIPSLRHREGRKPMFRTGLPELLGTGVGQDMGSVKENPLPFPLPQSYHAYKY